MTRKLVSLLAIVGLLLSLLTVTAAPVGASQANPVDPVHLSIQWGGCRGSVADYIQISGTTPFVCGDDGSDPWSGDYTTGNLGQGWNELDLIPERAELSLGDQATATTDYEIRIDGDGLASPGVIGYDFITTPVMNAELSDAGCAVTATGALQGVDAQGHVIAPRIYRIVSIHQPKGSDCVLDMDMRLAVGARFYPGSSLQSHIANSDGQGGQKTNSVPVGASEPQALHKDMTAVRNAAQIWDVTKGVTPFEVHFGDTCVAGADLSADVQVTVTWTKLGITPSGDATVLAHVTGDNPAHRSITFDVTDLTYKGTTQVPADLISTDHALVDVPGNSANFPIMTIGPLTVPGTDTAFNDVATATFIDTDTNIPIIGSATASASATVQQGSVSDSTVTVTDSESITGSNLTFSVAAPSVGSFTGATPYVADAVTTGPVDWSSGVQSASGSVTFDKTIYVPVGTATSGSLDDTATLTGSDGFTDSATGTITIDASRTSTLTITKTIPNVLQTGESAAFTFQVKDGSTVVGSVTITFAAGETSKTGTVSGLAFGTTYTVHEVPVTGWNPQQDQTVTPDGCAESVTFNNTFGPASAQVSKVTVPAGNEAGWDMTLTGPGTPVGGEKVTTTGASAIAFTTALQEGSYTISETGKTGWVQRSASTDCSFTVDYPADNGRLFSCTFTNLRPDARIVLSPLTATNPVGQAHTITATVTQNDQLVAGATGGDGTTGFGPAPNGTLVTFSLLNNTAGASFVSGNTCTTTAGSCTVQINSSTPGGVDIHATTTFSVLTVSLTRTTGDGLSYDSADAHKNYVAGSITIVKDAVPNSARDFNFTSTSNQTTTIGSFILDDDSDPTQPSSRTFSNLAPGAYTVTEGGLPITGWDLTDLTCTGGGANTTTSKVTGIATIGLDAGENVICTYTNTQRANVNVTKTFKGGAIPAGQSFTFDIRTGASQGTVGTPHEGTILKSVTVTSATVMPFSLGTNLVPGTYQICEAIPGPAWNMSMNLDPAAFMPNVDTGATLCVPVTLAAGDNLSLSFDNSPPPGGIALTIGYWKTHASCVTKGNKAAALDVALAKAPVALGQSKPGFYVGELYVDTCQEAVSLLSKQYIDSTKQQSSDPTINFASQYVAYQLNLLATAADNPQAANAAAEGQAVLVAVHFDGAANDGDPVHDTLTATQAATLNKDAGILDKFNNDTL